MKWLPLLVINNVFEEEWGGRIESLDGHLAASVTSEAAFSRGTSTTKS